MWTTVTWLLVAFASAGLVLYVLSIGATYWHTRKAARTDLPARFKFPPLSLLKPLKGIEERLEENLRTVFEQEYPAPREVIFSSADRHDPALEVARRVAADYPQVPTRWVVSDTSFGLNPKVANLAGALSASRHELVLQTDANVRIPPGYLRSVVAELELKQASVLSSMVVGVGERSLGATLENLQLSAFIAPGTCAALHLAGVPCVIGKSMLFRKADLQAVGGLESVRHVLAEDFVLGRELQARGKTVLLSPTRVENVNEHCGVEQFFARHSRWLKMRAVIHRTSFVADLFVNPLPVLTLAVALSGFNGAIAGYLGAVAIAKMTGDAVLVKLARGHWMAPHRMLMAPCKDLCMGAVWVYAAFSRTVRWRGVRLRFGKDTVLGSPTTDSSPGVPVKPLPATEKQWGRT